MTSKFKFPGETKVKNTERVDDMVPCRLLTCHRHYSRSNPKPDCVTIHKDCFDLLRRACAVFEVEYSQVADLIWIVAAWRRPAATSAPTRLSAHPYPMFDMKFLRVLSRACGLPHLARMPFDILQHIQAYSADAPFWRPIQVMVFFETVRNLTLGPTLTVPVAQLEGWECDKPILPYSSPKLDPIIRVTIDAHGISKIERLPEMPVYTGEVSRDRLFIVEPAVMFAKDIATIKVRASLSCWLTTLIPCH